MGKAEEAAVTAVMRKALAEAYAKGANAALTGAAAAFRNVATRGETSETVRIAAEEFAKMLDGMREALAAGLQAKMGLES